MREICCTTGKTDKVIVLKTGDIPELMLISAYLASNYTHFVNNAIMRYIGLHYAVLLDVVCPCQGLNKLELVSPRQAACRQRLHQQRKGHALILCSGPDSTHPLPSVSLRLEQQTSSLLVPGASGPLMLHHSMFSRYHSSKDMGISTRTSAGR